VPRQNARWEKSDGNDRASPVYVFDARLTARISRLSVSPSQVMDRDEKIVSIYRQTPKYRLTTVRQHARLIEERDNDG
jgi:hypothetical protein